MRNIEYQSEKFSYQVRNIKADNKTIPHLSAGVQFNVNLAAFQDHGRPCFWGSTIKSHPVLLDAAERLTPEERKKSDERFKIEIEQVLDGEKARKVTVLSSQGKPDIFVLSIGESFDPRSLRIYYTIGEFNNAPAIYRHAISTLKDSSRVERVFEDAGYRGTKNREKRRIH